MLGKHAIGSSAWLLSVAFINLAFAQSPYQGEWSGTYTYKSTSACTSLGAGGSSSYTEVCTGTDPWKGSVSANGRLTVFRYTGSSVCTTDIAHSDPDYFNSAGDAAPFSYGVINSGGMITVPAVTVTRTLGTTTVIGTCPQTVFQFMGASMSNTTTCPQTSHDVSGNVTTDCSGSNTSTWLGSEGPAVLAPPKVSFPMTVTSNITATVASATAQVSPPPAQVGTSGSVYVFAHARLSIIPGAKREMAAIGKDGTVPDPCVLAQLNTNGQLSVTSGSALQAYSTGVLSSQSQSVTILNNVPTANVTGATFMVGYGTTGSDMLASGNYEGAVSVSGLRLVPGRCSRARHRPPRRRSRGYGGIRANPGGGSASRSGET